MKSPEGTLKICSRGHKFYKSSDCPVCPVCWPGYYKKRSPSDFPKKLAAKRMKVMPKKPLKIVCCLIFDSQKRLLLLKRHAEDLGGGLWATPGGRQTPGEDPKKTAIREAKEETGLDLVEIKYLGNHELRMPHGVAHMMTFQSQVNGDEKIVIDHEEHEGHQWFDIKNLLSAEGIIWGLPTTLLDFGLIEAFDADPTLADGSEAILLELA